MSETRDTYDHKTRAAKLLDVLDGDHSIAREQIAVALLEAYRAGETAALPRLSPLPGRRQRLTERQREVLDYVRRYTAAYNRPPSTREICAHMGITSTNGVTDHLKAIERKGYIHREDHKSRTIRLVGFGVRDQLEVLGHPRASVLDVLTTCVQAADELGCTLGWASAARARVLLAARIGAAYAFGREVTDADFASSHASPAAPVQRLADDRR